MGGAPSSNSAMWKMIGFAVTIVLLLVGWLYSAMADQIQENTNAIRTMEKVLPQILTELKYINRQLERHTEADR